MLTVTHCTVIPHWDAELRLPVYLLLEILETALIGLLIFNLQNLIINMLSMIA